MSERKKHIAVLKEMLEWMNMSSEVIKKDDPFFRVHEHRKKAVKYAISSLETDEAYQLEYESTTKNNLGVDAVSRQAINGYIDYILSHGNLGVDAISRQSVANYIDYIQNHGMGKKKSFDFIKKFVANMSSVTLKEPTEKCTWIKYDYRTMCPKEHIDVDNPYWRIPENKMETLKYCPYCGKEIEVEE